MNSRLYNCRITHKRITPKKHGFSYSVFMFYIDLDEIETLKNLFLISYERFNYYTYRDSDHLQEGASKTKDNLLRYVRSKGITESIGKIYLLTQLRILNYTFNPVSFYFIFNNEEEPICVVAEVANTFNEQKLYLLNSNEFNGTSFKAQRQKHFYISPFSELNIDLSFNLKIPNEKLNLQVNNTKNGEVSFFSNIKGKSVKLTNSNLTWFTIRYPLLTFMVIFRIHIQALKLLIKGIPYFKKADNPHLQRETRVYLNKSKKPSFLSKIFKPKTS